MTSTAVPAVPARVSAAPSAADWVRLFVPGVIWGASFLFIAEGLQSFPPLLITPLRVGFGFVTVGCFRASRASVRREDWSRIVLLAVLWMAFPLTMFPLAEQRVSSSVTGMLNGATALFVATVAAVLVRKLPPWKQLVGLLIGFAGVVLIAIPTLGQGRSSVTGVVLIFCALVSYGFALNLAVPLQQRYGALPVLWRVQAVAFAITAPIGATKIGQVHLHVRPVLAVMALGIFGTAVAYALATNNAGRLGSTRAAVTTYVIPVVALVLGAVLRNESVAALAVVGCGVALAGAYLAGRHH